MKKKPKLERKKRLKVGRKRKIIKKKNPKEAKGSKKEEIFRIIKKRGRKVGSLNKKTIEKLRLLKESSTKQQH